jgi:rhodanese-related sulfurtransferase
MSKNDNRTTVFVAVATFAGLSVVTFLVWSLTRPEEAAQAATPPVHVAIASSGEQTFERVAFEEFKSAVDAKLVTVIDVRSMEQYLAGHIPGALHIPVGRVEGEIPYLPKDKPVVTYCTCPAEESSGQAAMILVNGGIPAKALAGGFDEWTKRGLPVKAGVE